MVQEHTQALVVYNLPNFNWWDFNMREQEMLEEIKARCENWYYCFRDGKPYQVSSLYHLMKYLEKYSLQYKPPNKFNPIKLSKGKNIADAELLQNVWRGLDSTQERLQVNVRFISFSLPMSDVKKIISIYTFSGRDYRKHLKYFKRRLPAVSAEDYHRIEDQALLHFAREVARYE